VGLAADYGPTFGLGCPLQALSTFQLISAVVEQQNPDRLGSGFCLRADRYSGQPNVPSGFPPGSRTRALYLWNTPGAGPLAPRNGRVGGWTRFGALTFLLRHQGHPPPNNRSLPSKPGGGPGPAPVAPRARVRFLRCLPLYGIPPTTPRGLFQQFDA